MNTDSRNFIKYWVPVLFFAAAIFINSSQPPSPLLKEIRIPFFDKILHLVCYSCLGYLLLRALLNYGYGLPRPGLIFIAVALGTLYGISDEFHQMFVPERTTEIADVVCDFFGSAAGSVIYNHRFKNAP